MPSHRDHPIQRMPQTLASNNYLQRVDAPSTENKHEMPFPYALQQPEKARDYQKDVKRQLVSPKADAALVQHQYAAAAMEAAGVVSSAATARRLGKIGKVPADTMDQAAM